MQISADSNYAVYVNGVLAASGQYPDFPHYKIYDEIDLAAYCTPGRNHLAIIVWYYGDANMSYYPAPAALLYALKSGDTLLCCSNAATVSRQSRTYRCGLRKNITGQLGFTFHYDASRADGWMTGALDGFSPSVIVNRSMAVHPRPVERCVRHDAAPSRLVLAEESKHFLYDLGCEEVGLLYLHVVSPVKQTLTISYGEHIADGGVRRIIGGRDFSMEVTVPAGETCYINPFRRLGLRYLELHCDSPVEVRALTVCPVSYPLTQHACPAGATPLQQRIWDVAARTLVLCMHDHYEDSPWREQALYALDSRNQILCGYYAFGETAFPRANLLLMSHDRRHDNLLSICTPTACDLTIPSFSLHYIIEVYEYLLYTGDTSLIHAVMPTMQRVMDVFLRRIDSVSGLTPVFSEPCHWNFYEWSDGMSGSLGEADGGRYDAALNCLLSLALHAMTMMCDAIQAPNDYQARQQLLNSAINEAFFDKETGLYRNSTKDKRASELVNSLTILCGAADPDISQRVAAALATGNCMPATLSTRCFKYDALLKVNKELYAPYILQDIDTRYERMLATGYTTAFWETENGMDDFELAGSLCHGWSAMPIYYYATLLDPAAELPLYYATDKT